VAIDSPRPIASIGSHSARLRFFSIFSLSHHPAQHSCPRLHCIASHAVHLNPRFLSQAASTRAYIIHHLANPLPTPRLNAFSNWLSLPHSILPLSPTCPPSKGSRCIALQPFQRLASGASPFESLQISCFATRSNCVAGDSDNFWKSHLHHQDTSHGLIQARF
jgi:hypothetical protein